MKYINTMKFPKKVMIDGREWSIVLNKKSDGAYIDAGKMEISIGTEEDTGLKNFIHETIENICIFNHLRYRNLHAECENGDLIFVFNHEQFEKMCSDFSIVFREFLRINGVK